MWTVITVISWYVQNECGLDVTSYESWGILNFKKVCNSHGPPLEKLEKGFCLPINPNFSLEGGIQRNVFIFSCKP